MADYDVIDETDPYYWSINEFDMLSNFNHKIADQAGFADTMTSPASGSPSTPVMCAQKSLDYTEIRENRMIECISDMKPVYRKTPVPKRKLTRISESVTVSPSSSNLPHAHSQVHCKSKLPSYKSQLWTHEGEGQTIDSNNTTTDCMVHPTVDKNAMPT